MPHPKGGYKNKEGKRATGVTTITGRFKDSGGLLWWAYAQGQANERGETSTLYEKRDEAANAGTLAHSLVEAHINKATPPKIPDNEVGELAQQGFKNYLNWQEDNRMVVVAQEMGMVSDKYSFGGCPDAVAFNGRGQLVMLDWKTSNGVYPDYIIQLAAYGMLWNENHPDNPITGGYHLCRFSKEYADFAHYYWSELDDAWEQFKLFRRAYDIDLKLKKRVK